MELLLKLEKKTFLRFFEDVFDIYQKKKDPEICVTKTSN